MTNPLRDVQIRYADGRKSRPYFVRIDFDETHALEVHAQADGAMLVLQAGPACARLQTNGPNSHFTRAVNLLRLHLPPAASLARGNP